MKEFVLGDGSHNIVQQVISSASDAPQVGVGAGDPGSHHVFQQAKEGVSSVLLCIHHELVVGGVHRLSSSSSWSTEGEAGGTDNIQGRRERRLRGENLEGELRK